MERFEQQFVQMRDGKGFIAALDQSGGSTPKALRLYGIPEGSWRDEAEMMNLVHAMRARIITSAPFNGDRVLGSILFEDTVRREIEGYPSAEYLWKVKGVVPFLKVDKGLEDEADGVQLMKPIPVLDELLELARAQGIFGTKMRSVIKQARPDGIEAVVAQQFDLARQIISTGRVPIVEPEVDIRCPDKAEAEALLERALLKHLDSLGGDEHVMLKLTPPEKDNHYLQCVKHPRVVRVVALSGGYSREEANARLARQNGVVASFSRALTEGLSVDQTEEKFNRTLDASIESIYQASLT